MSSAVDPAPTDLAALAPDREPPADTPHAPPPIRIGDVYVHHAEEQDIPAIVALNNLYAPDGLTLPRSEAFVTAHLADYQVIRNEAGGIMGQVALDEYSPSLVELVSLAVAPDAQGQGIGQRLITAALHLARERGYPELFAISLADSLFIRMGFRESSIVEYPEKIARYRTISRSELSIGRKFCFSRNLLDDTM